MCFVLITIPHGCSLQACGLLSARIAFSRVGGSFIWCVIWWVIDGRMLFFAWRVLCLNCGCKLVCMFEIFSAIRPPKRLATKHDLWIWERRKHRWEGWFVCTSYLSVCDCCTFKTLWGWGKLPCEAPPKHWAREDTRSHMLDWVHGIRTSPLLCLCCLCLCGS